MTFWLAFDCRRAGRERYDFTQIQKIYFYLGDDVMTRKWILVRGGICLYGDNRRPKTVKDLLWSSTPITHGQLAREHHHADDLPVASITHAEAISIAASIGGRLPTSVEWEWMAGGSHSRQFPWGNEEWSPDRANLRESGIAHVTPVGSYPLGNTPEDLIDVAGNVWEWTASRPLGGGAVIRG